MTYAIPIDRIQLAPGNTLSVHNLSWQDFETILTDLGDKRSTRIAYYQGTLEIMSPLAIHERPHRIIADIVKALLDLEGKDWEDFGSTTLKRPEVAGVEPIVRTHLWSQRAIVEKAIVVRMRFNQSRVKS